METLRDTIKPCHCLQEVLSLTFAVHDLHAAGPDGSVCEMALAPACLTPLSSIWKGYS